MINPNEIAIKQAVSILNSAYQAAVRDGLLPQTAALVGNITRDYSHGDLAANHAMVGAKAFGLPPRKIAEILLEKADFTDSFFSGAEIAGPGFINFRLNDGWFSYVADTILSENDKYGMAEPIPGSRVMVEFVSANPTGPMTIGNARGGALGDTLANVLTYAGSSVYREFYVNDAGNQVDLFGKSLSARYMRMILGEDAVAFPENGYHGEDIRERAAEIYALEGTALAELTEEERERRLIEYALPRNIAAMKEDLALYRVEFDNWFLESGLHANNKVAEAVAVLSGAGLTYEKDGAVWLKNTELGADKDEVLLRANGFYTYYATDIAYHLDKFGRGFSRVIDVWGADHHGHAIRFAHTMAAPGIDISADRLVFLIMQMVRLTRGGETVKVSKRTGKALTLYDLTQEISVDACRWFFNAKPDNHLEFDLDLAVREDSENPVYYVQYAYARICSLIDKLYEESPELASVDCSGAVYSEDAERELIRQLSLLPDTIKKSADNLDPSEINRYLLTVAQKFHKFYTDCKIRGQAAEIAAARLRLSKACAVVIKTCLGIIGVTAKERM
ncbi:MAG: arginine--tRNA ligase [Oscillospiraceae bacterium]|jgi:arginyl-tRNA synthetase|nr:arginine--tRNA ligase [Oscillospiraceae bacterium]